MNRVLMLVTISSRKKISEFVKFYKTHQVETGTISLGRGTASSEMLDCLGMEDEEKGIFFSIITEPIWQKMQKGLQKEMKIDIPGTGIALRFRSPVLVESGHWHFFWMDRNLKKRRKRN